jgi:hypothetical protein
MYKYYNINICILEDEFDYDVNKIDDEVVLEINSHEPPLYDLRLNNFEKS